MHTPGASSPLWEGPEPWVLSGWEAALSQASLGAVALGDPGSHLLPSASSRPGQPAVPSSCVPPAGPGPGEQGGGTGRAPGEEGLWLYLVGQAPSLAAQRGQEQHPAGPGGSDHSSPLPAAQTSSSRQAPCGAEAKAGERAVGEELGRCGLHSILLRLLQFGNDPSQTRGTGAPAGPLPWGACGRPFCPP